MKRQYSDGGSAGVEDSIQDQIIIAPEIMRMILENLDIRSLKRVRLVCKSWLREAATHMEKKGITRFTCGGIQEFAETFQNKLPDLPQPFHSIRFGSIKSSPPQDAPLLVNQLSSLCPPLEITRFDASGIPLNLVVSLITQCSSSIERLGISVSAGTREWDLPPMDQTQVFPQLRNLYLSAEDPLTNDNPNHFPSVVAWIVKSAPSLESYESEGCLEDGCDECNDLLLEVDVQNVKALALTHDNLRDAVLEHFISIPFIRLEHLKMGVITRVAFELNENVQIAAVTKCEATLRSLDLTYVTLPEYLAGFPVCRQVKELKLNYFPKSSHFISDSFPNLQALRVINEATVDVNGDSWKDMDPFLGLKTLNVKHFSFGDDYSYEDEYFLIEQTLKFLEKFPALECLGLPSPFVLHCCRLRASGEPRFSKLLEGVKNLVLYDNRPCNRKMDPDFAPLAVLKGVEEITMASKVHSDRDVLLLPYKDMPSLKVIRFSWNLDDRMYWLMDTLLDMAKRVEKIGVTNCCFIRHSDDTLIKILAKDLRLFFDSAPNVECGCQDERLGM